MDTRQGNELKPKLDIENVAFEHKYNMTHTFTNSRQACLYKADAELDNSIIFVARGMPGHDAGEGEDWSRTTFNAHESGGDLGPRHDKSLRNI